MLKTVLEKDLKEAIAKLGFKKVDIDLYIPENSHFGDYTSNIALRLPKLDSTKSNHSPQDTANQIMEKLGHPGYLERVEVAGPGFINFWVKDDILIKILSKQNVILTPVRRGEGSNKAKKVLVEYGHVNILKEIHIGHLRTFILGESLSRILQHEGNQVFRANYQGDIGLHVAKALWGINYKGGFPKQDLPHAQMAQFLGQAYAEGNRHYEEDPNIKSEIDQINSKLYQKDQVWLELYNKARQESLNYFEPIYELLGVKYDRCFFESEVADRGKQLVNAHIGTVFKENEGALIFEGEKFGLHTRVFVSSAGHPTYEGKEIGLAELEYETFPYDFSIHVVGSEQEGYFKVVIKAVELTFPHLAKKKMHLSYGMVDITEGKMSSRTGEVITVNELLDKVVEQIEESIKEAKVRVDEPTIQKIAIGAIKFTFLKFSPRTNVVFNIKQSVSLHGDSGPYLQYTYARTQSVLRQPGLPAISLENKQVLSFEPEEREILRLLMYYDEVVYSASSSLSPHVICEYLINLAKAFNQFYQNCNIIKSKKENFRLLLTKRVGEALRTGLDLLGIEAVERM